MDVNFVLQYIGIESVTFFFFRDDKFFLVLILFECQ